MTIRPSLALAALTAFCAPLAAQSASFSNFGSGCMGSGSGGQVCKSDNGSATQLESLFFSRTSEVAIEVPGINSPLITGFEILTSVPSFRTKQTFNAHIYFADAQGAPLTTPAVTGSMTVDKAVAWYRVVFPKPLLVKPGQRFFLSWTDKYVPFSQTILWPVPKPGRAKTVSYHRESNSGSFRGPFTLHPWAWRVLCPGGNAVPVLSNTGLPKLGQSYSVDLSKAKPTTGAVLITGVSKTVWGAFTLPLSLATLGASGCNLYVSYDVPTGLATGAGGAASLPIPVPNDPGLAGVKLHHQWMIVDGGTNSLGLVFTGAGTAVLGN